MTQVERKRIRAVAEQRDKMKKDQRNGIIKKMPKNKRK